MKKKINLRWVARIVLISVVVSVVFTFASSEALERTGNIIALVILLVFIGVGVMFDMIGAAVISAQEAPFHSMASRRERGAPEALKLLKNAEKASSYCNDVVGDVSGIVSGATAALIAQKLSASLNTESVLLSLLVSGVVAGLTIWGKAIGKTRAINNSTAIVLRVGRFLNFFHIKK